MRKSIFFAIGIFIASMLFTTGCVETKSVPADTLGIDSILDDTTDTDTLSEMIAEETMPVAADELFDDFFFNYAASKKVQKERTRFPLPVDDMGKHSTKEKNEWRRESFFMGQGYFTLIFNHAKEINLMKDTAVSDVTVEKIDVGRNRVMRWHFSRQRGLWYLDGIKTIALSQHHDAGFLRFYEQFVTDSVFQQQSLAETVSFTGPDPDDDFSTMTGEIMQEQWPMFEPWMPSGILYNIQYGAAPYPASDVRFFLIRGIANGLFTDLVFTRKGKGWQLKKINT